MAQVLAAFGAIFGVIGGYFIWIACTMETTVTGGAAPAGFDGIANLQLMHIQAMNLHIGLGSAAVAAIFIIGGAIVSAIKDRPTG